MFKLLIYTLLMRDELPLKDGWAHWFTRCHETVKKKKRSCARTWKRRHIRLDKQGKDTVAEELKNMEACWEERLYRRITASLHVCLQRFYWFAHRHGNHAPPLRWCTRAQLTQPLPRSYIQLSNNPTTGCERSVYKSKYDQFKHSQSLVYFVLWGFISII